jgi:hypothetical protein
MSDPVDLDAKRKSKAPKCEICGQGIHDYVGQCPQIASIEYEREDGTIVRYILRPLAWSDPV